MAGAQRFTPSPSPAIVITLSPSNLAFARRSESRTSRHSSFLSSLWHALFNHCRFLSTLLDPSPVATAASPEEQASSATGQWSASPKRISHIRPKSRPAQPLPRICLSLFLAHAWSYYNVPTYPRALPPTRTEKHIIDGVEQQVKTEG